MEFEYTSSIYINEDDLQKMARRSLNENFYDVFYDVMAGYDDCDYYNCGLIIEAVHAEVAERIAKLRTKTAKRIAKLRNSQ